MSDTREAIERAADWITEHMQPVADRRSGDSLATRILEASGLIAERDEWKARAEKAEAELTDAQWERESLREKANGLEVERADAVRDLTRMLDNGAQTLAMVRASRREVSAERERLQEQVEQAREILHELFTNAAIDGRNNWQPVEAFLRAYPVAARSGSPDTGTT